MTDLYLIAHKVSGEPAFDIAIKMERSGPDGPEEPSWIIPTSGHRAYPYWYYPLGDLFAYQNVGLPPADLRDHYQTEPSRSESPSASLRERSQTIPNLEDI